MPSLKDLTKNLFKELVDSLNKFILFLFFIFFIISFFIKNFYIDLIKVLLLILFLFRLFSKNKIKRKQENNFFLKIKKCLLKPFEVIIKNNKDKNHVYKRCSKCKTILKLPLPQTRGIKHTKCPNCHKKISFFTFKKEKIIIEVIKKK